MSYWQENLLDASFGGAPFHMQNVSDSVEKALAIYEYPYRDGAEVEDMGRRARRIPITALFWGDGYFEAMQKLVQAFEVQGKGELIHPVFGSLQVTIQSYTIDHTAERPDYATVSFECIESILDSTFFSSTSSKGMGQKAAQSANSAAKSAEDVSIAAVVGVLQEAAKLPGIAQAQVLTYLDTVLDVFDAAHTVVRSVLNYIENPLAFVADLAAVLDVPLLDTALNVVDRVVDTTQDAFATFTRISTLYPRLPAMPGQNVFTYATGMAGYSVSYITGVKATEQARAEPILVLAVPKKDGESLEIPVGAAHTVQGVVATHVQIATASRVVNVVQDMLLAQITHTPTLTPQQMETLTGNGRARLQDAIDYTHASLDVRYIYSTTEGLRTAAESLQELAAYALSARPPLTRYTTTFECNFYYLAHYLYKDYTRAAELRFLNSYIRNPNFIAKGQELLIYAK